MDFGFRRVVHRLIEIRVHDVALAIFHAVDDFRKIVDRVRSENKIQIGRAFEELALVELPHAATDSDDRAFAFFFEILKESESRDRLVNGFLANGATVDDDQVRVSGEDASLIPCSERSAPSVPNRPRSSGSQMF